MNIDMRVDMIAIDLDGTLVDSVGDLHEAVFRMQNVLGLCPATADQVRLWVGNGIERLVHRSLTGSMNRDADVKLFNTALHEFKVAYEDVNGTRSRLYPGVRDGLDWLATLDVPMVLVTNKARQFTLPLLISLRIDDHFSHFICGDDVELKKPDPEALYLAARYCAAVPQRSVLIGDSVSDFKAAHAAGFRAVGASYGYNHGQSIRDITDEWRPEAIIDSFEELPGVLRRLIAPE